MVMGIEVAVTIRLKPGVADPEGENTKKALNLLGFSNVRAVRTMKRFIIELEGGAHGDTSAIRAEVEEMCKKLLANPVIQDYEIAIEAETEAEPEKGVER